MLRIALLIALFSASVCGSSHRCVAPPFFEARVDQVDLLSGKFERIRFFYDAFFERERFISEPIFNASHARKDVIIHWKEHMMYELDMKTRKCNVTRINGEFRRIEIGWDFTYAESFDIGTIPGEGVQLGVWYKKENSTYAQGLIVREFTRFHCMPFFEWFEGTLMGKEVKGYRTFVNIVTQVVDPDVFEVPKECKK